MEESLNLHTEPDGSVSWSTPRKTDKLFVIRLFGPASEKLFAAEGEDENVLAQCTTSENPEVEVRPGKYNILGGDMRVTYLHQIEVGEDGSVKETRLMFSDALRNNIFGGDLLAKSKAPLN